MVCLLIMSGDATGTKEVKIAHFDDGRHARNYQRLCDKRTFSDGRWEKVVWAEDWKEYSTEISSPINITILLKMDNRSIQKMMREVDSQELAMALKSLDAEVSDRIFSNMSKRAADMLKEDMEYMGPIAMDDVQEAQHKILAIIDHLIDVGEIPDFRKDVELVV